MKSAISTINSRIKEKNISSSHLLFFFFFIFIEKVVKSIEFVRIRRWTTSNERNWSREHVARMFRGIDIGMKALLTVITAWATSNFRYSASRCVAIGLTHDDKRTIYPRLYRNSITNIRITSSASTVGTSLSLFLSAATFLWNNKVEERIW